MDRLKEKLKTKYGNFDKLLSELPEKIIIFPAVFSLINLKAAKA